MVARNELGDLNLPHRDCVSLGVHPKGVEKMRIKMPLDKLVNLTERRTARMMGVTLKQYKKMCDDLMDAVEDNLKRKNKNGQKI